MTFIEVERPYRIVAVGRGGKFNRNKTYTTWTLSPSGGGTRVEHTTESEPQLPTDRLMESFGMRRFFKRGGRKALRAPAVHPRGGPRPGPARHGRGRLGFRP